MINQVNYKGLYSGSFHIIDESGEIHTWFFRDIERIKMKMRPYEAKGEFVLFQKDKASCYEFTAAPSLRYMLRTIMEDFTKQKATLKTCDTSRLNDLKKWGLCL